MSKLPPWVKGSSKIIAESIIGPAIYTFWMSSFSFLVFVVFDCSQRKPQRFFGSGPIWTHLEVLGANNFSKQRLIGLKFWAQVVLIVVQMPFKAF